MTCSRARIFVDALLAYGLAGAVFAAAFLTLGIHRVVPVAAHASIGFRLLVLPGAAALWPLLLVRWIRGATL